MNSSPTADIQFDQQNKQTENENLMYHCRPFHCNCISNNLTGYCKNLQKIHPCPPAHANQIKDWCSQTYDN